MVKKAKRRGLIHQLQATWRWFWYYHKQCNQKSDAYRKWKTRWLASPRWRDNDGRC